MYKLFLCLRYLKSRVIAYFAMLGVTLCVAMMVIVVSVMTGFVNKIEKAAKGLFGDIVMDTTSQHGLALYDEFIEEVRRKVPEVAAAAPYILSYGHLRIQGQDRYSHGVQIAGIRLPGHARVSDFGQGLFAQAGMAEPTWDPPVPLLLKRVAEEGERTRNLRAAVAGRGSREGGMPADKADLVADLLRRIDNALALQREGARNLRDADANRARLARARKLLDEAEENGADERKLADLRLAVSQMQRVAWEGPEDRAVVGLGIPGLSFRTESGQVVRLWVPGHKIILFVFPLGTGSIDASGLHPEIRNFSVIDDCKTGVASLDSLLVYVPFDTLQKLSHMEARYAPDDPAKVVEPARCSQLLFKVKAHSPSERDLRSVRAKIHRAWLEFREQNPRVAWIEVSVETWRQRQAKLVNTIESQRTLMVIILGIISLVALVLIFVIFYMIVVQKTRDIGVLKSIGASSAGVAGIFLAYGAAVGLVGSTLGSAMGYFFVRNINPIADWISETFDFRVWDREFFMFDKIPNEVQLMTIVNIVIGAIVAALIGTLLPAVRAARMQPVEALRYE